MNYNPYKKYSSCWWKYWLNLPSDLSSFFTRILDYMPLLWEDNDYDFNATLRLMRFKLRRLRQHMGEHAIIAHAEDVFAELAKADVLLRNVIDEDPDDEWSFHYSQWHAGNDFGEKCKAQKECRKALDMSHARAERNWHDLWSFVDKNARGWWD